MAIWQFDLAIVPRGAQSSGCAPLGAISTLPEVSVVELHALLTAKMGQYGDGVTEIEIGSTLNRCYETHGRRA